MRVKVTGSAVVGGIFDVERWFLASLEKEDSIAQAPILAFHSPVDEEAPYEDALVSVERLRRRGAAITVRTLPGFDHVNIWVQALPRTVRWFRAMK